MTNKAKQSKLKQTAARRAFSKERNVVAALPIITVANN